MAFPRDRVRVKWKIILQWMSMDMDSCHDSSLSVLQILTALELFYKLNI